MALRILHVAAFGPDAWGYGGIPRVVGALTHGLAARGHRVTLCITDARDGQSRLPGSGGRVSSWCVTDAGVDTRIFPNLSNRAAYHLQAFLPLGLRAFLRASAHTFDIAHIHGCHHLPGLFAADALRAAGVPYVVSPNGTAPMFERRVLPKRILHRLGGHRVLDGAAQVLAVSRAEARQFQALGIALARTGALVNPVGDDALSHMPAQVAAGRGATVLFLGKVTPRKHVDVLVDGFARVAAPDATLVIAGNDLGGLAAAHRRVAAHNLAARVRFTGLLQGHARLDALAQADVVVYASSDEVFGLVACEALLMGTPVIVANDSGCAEVLDAVGGGLAVPPRDAAALSDALQRVLEDRSTWRDRARSAASRIRARYAPDVVVRALEQVYQDVLAAPVPERLSA